MGENVDLLTADENTVKTLRERHFKCPSDQGVFNTGTAGDGRTSYISFWNKDNLPNSGNADSGYPSAVQLADGSVAIVSYAVGSGLLPVVLQAQCAILSTEVLKNLSK